MAIFNKKHKSPVMPKKQTARLEQSLLNLKKQYVKHITSLGAHIFHYGKYSIYKASKFLKREFSLLTSKTACFFSKVSKKIIAKLKNRVKRVPSYMKELRRDVSAKRKSSNIFSATGLFFATIFKSIWKTKGIFVTAFNYAAPVVAIIFLVNVVSFGTNVSYGISVECNGQNVGYIESEEEFNQAQKFMQEGDQEIKVVSKLSVQKISDKSEVISSYELADKMIINSNVPVVEAYGFYINGVFSGVVKDKTEIQKTLDGILDSYRTGAADEVVQFVDKFELKFGTYQEKGIIDPATITNTLKGEKQVEAYYTVVSGDAPTSIAEKVGMPYEDLKILNPTIEKSCMIGDQILLNRSEPFASVRITRTEEYDIALDYKITKENDASLYKGVEKVIVKGVEGSAHVRAEVALVNGYEESRKILEQTTIKEPVDKKVAVGTKSGGAPADLIAASGGNYLWPVGGGYISQGYRSYHRAIDIAAPAGTPIYAANDGQVTVAHDSYIRGYSYGRYVVIDHGGGFSTLYGHASKLNVSEGQTVQKGDIIAFVGDTGDSDGNHLHFEVKNYKSRLNPVSFLGK